MKFISNRSEWSWSITQDVIPVTTFMPRYEWNPDWRFTDGAGHDHYRSAEKPRFPTLKKKTTKPSWCESCEDEHDDTYYVCRRCKVAIVPGMRTVVGGPKSIQGLRDGRIEGPRGIRLLGESEINDVLTRGQEAVDEIAADWPGGPMWIQINWVNP